MADLTLPEVIIRFRGNEARIAEFTNGNAAGYYITVDGKKVETLPSVVSRLAAAIAAASATRNDLAAATGAGLIGYGSVTLKAFLDDLAKTLDATKKVADAALPQAGGTLTGPLILAGAPTANLHAASKAYVDSLALQTGFQEFTTSGTFNKPSLAKWVYVELVAGGCGGCWAGAPAQSSTAYIAGGGGGDMNAKLFRASDLPDALAVIVGAGSPGSAYAQLPSVGGDSKFGTLLTARGGGVPSGTVVGYSTPVPPHSWVGGEPGRVITNANGQYAGVQSGGRSIRGGGGGAGCMGTYYGTLSIGGATGGDSSEAGKGGNGASNNDGALTVYAGGNGGYPGGGGGGCLGGTKAGDGGNGRVRVWWW